MKPLQIISLVLFILYCNPQDETSTYLIRVCDEENCELGTKTGYIDQQGDTIVPTERYYYCYTDTIRSYGIILDHNGICKAIDKTGKELYQVKWYDNGPDYLSDGLFRIIIDGKEGYANEMGEIVIQPKFECTTPFENGKAKVTYKCELIREGEHTRMESNEWFYIDKKGNRIE